MAGKKPQGHEDKKKASLSKKEKRQKKRDKKRQKDTSII